jgi:Protein of unknown function (DUF3795)
MLTENKLLIAPCGMNCGTCMAYLRERNKCPGCRVEDSNKPVTRRKCKIKHCELLENNKYEFCFVCESFPCERLQHLDKRYRTKYNMSMIKNLQFIKNYGIEKFLMNEKKRWICTDCGGTINVHKGICSRCGEKIA